MSAPILELDPRATAVRRFRDTAMLGIGLAMLLSLLSYIPSLPEMPWNDDVPAPVEAVDARPATVTEPGSDPTAGTVLDEAPPEPEWPITASRTVSDPSTVEVGGLPIAVTAAEPVDVVVHGQDMSDRLGIDGVVVDLDGDASTVSVDYSSFSTAFGADWSTRLRVVELTDCGGDGACEVEAVASVNDVTESTVTADVNGDGRFAVVAAASGTSGDYGASSLSASQAWSAGGAAGDFSWSYPVPVPPGIGGPEPTVLLSYSSQAVDGRTAASNNQPSWIGEGFDYQPGFIERKYIPCAEDMGDGANNVQKTGDLCWFDDNAFMSVAGTSTELIKDTDTGEWRPKTEDGSRIELKTGGPNGDDDGEHWVVTTLDGTRLWFGRNQLPGWTDGAAVTNSVLTVPVFGNHSGEPCNVASFAGSDCRQAWRWQLDYVEDAWGNTSSYWYGKDANRYARNADQADAMSYDRDGYLKRIDYGTTSTTAYGKAAYQVLFTTADRCIENCGEKKEANWPDTPWDQECVEGPCTDNYSPTFWSTRRLSTIATQVLAGTTYRPVDTITLRHSFREPGDGTRAGLFLEGITRTGHTAVPEITLPEVTFTGIQLPNRVDGIDNAPPMNWFRIGSIRTESGGEIGVHYADAECTPDTLPDEPGTNTARCFPVWWTPADYGDPDMDWFHKYVVEAVTMHDHTGGSDSPRTVTRYEYLGGGAWHYEDGNGLIKKKLRTWSQWRGYETVRTIVGDDGDSPVITETRFHRGMNGDKDPAGGTKSVSVTASDGTSAVDYGEFTGRPREAMTIDGTTGAAYASQISEYWRSDPTASRDVAGRTVHARFVNTSKVTASSYLDEHRGWRATSTSTTYNDLGLPVTSRSHGDPSSTSDDTCTTTEYAHNQSTWVVVPIQVTTLAIPCDQMPTTASDVIGMTRMIYDGGSFGSPPSQGNLTSSLDAAEWTPTDVRWVETRRATYDSHGRVVAVTDATGATSSTTFVPATGAPVRSVSQTNALGWKQTTAVDILRGHANNTVDVNGKRTEAEYDALGRTLKVWLPDRPRTSWTPNVEYSYVLSQVEPSSVTTKTLIHNGSYVSSVVLYDSLLRQRQQQVPAVGGGRVVTDQFYDSVGRPFKTYNGWLENTAGPSTTIVSPDSEAMLSSVSLQEFDSRGQLAADVFQSLGAERWRTSYVRDGDRTTVIPPDGGVVRTTVTDLFGRTVEDRIHEGRTPDSPFSSTYYEYDRASRLTSITDMVGNEWTYDYDFRGRMTSSTDPDSGETSVVYDDAGMLTSVTDARGETLAYTYDALGRTTSVRDDTVDGPVRIGYTFDTVAGAKGLPAAATRYVDGKAYSAETTSYDDLYRPMVSRVTIPEGHGELSGTYIMADTYDQDGSIRTMGYPNAGGLSSETVRYYYDQELGLPYQLGTSSGGAYVIDTQYNALGMLQRIEQSASVMTSGSVYQTFEYETDTRRLSRMVVSRSSVSPNRLQELSFQYDDAGNVLSITDKPEVETGIVGRNERQCFEYDHLRRLTEAWTPASDDCSSGPSASDLGGPAPYWQSYSYDATGNRAQRVEHAAPGTPQTTTVDYSYPAAGAAQPHTLTSTETAVTGTAGSFTHSYEYDVAGNMTRRPDGLGKLQDLSWNAEGRLESVSDTDSGEELASYIYDAAGRRLIGKDASGETLYLGRTEIDQKADTGEVTAKRYYTHAGLTVAVRSTENGLTWLTADQQGTNALAVDADTMAVEQRRQDPFGNPRGAEPTAWPDQRGFVGGIIDPTGLTSVGAREYDPDLGRFISDDPIFDASEPQSWNGYAYANNSPITYTDPTGLWWGWLSDTWDFLTGAAKWVAETLYEATGIPDAIDLVGAVVDGDWETVGFKIVEMAVEGAVNKILPGVGKLAGDQAVRFAKWLIDKMDVGKTDADDILDAVNNRLDETNPPKKDPPKPENTDTPKETPDKDKEKEADDEPPATKDDPKKPKEDGKDPVEEARNLADETRAKDMREKKRPGMAESIKLTNGRTITYTSVKGKVDPEVHPDVKGILDAVDDRAGGHGRCGLVVCLTDALNAGDDPTRAIAAAFQIRAPNKVGHGDPRGPCKSCRPLSEKYELEWLTHD